jgi:hypothetical protein
VGLNLLGARRRLLTTLAATAAGLGLMPHAKAAATTPFGRSVVAGGVTLQLNGAGTRYRFAFKVYDMALYTTKKVSTPAELLALPGPKRLQFVALRELPGTDLGRLFLRGMGDNASVEQMNRHGTATTRLIDVFSGRPKLLPGETFAMEFEPGKGTSFYIQGKPQGAPVGDDEFFGLVLRIWFGESPADHLLRDALLDRSRD